MGEVIIILGLDANSVISINILLERLDKKIFQQ